MKDPHEVILPSGDAAVLRRLLREHSSTSSPASWSEELAALPRHARIVAPAYLPPGRIAIGSSISYVTEPKARLGRNVGAAERLAVQCSRSGRRGFRALPWGRGSSSQG